MIFRSADPPAPLKYEYLFILIYKSDEIWPQLTRVKLSDELFFFITFVYQFFFMCLSFKSSTKGYISRSLALVP